MIKKALQKLGLLLSLSVGFVIAGCSGDDAARDEDLMEGVPVEVAFSLSSRYNGVTTRADGTPKDPVHENEKIKNWFIVFADKTNTVRKVLHRNDVETGINMTQAGAVEEETFRCILPSGTYNVYAFANISELTLSAAASGDGTDLLFTVGSALPANIESAVWKSVAATENTTATELNLLDIATTAIPMTGFLKNIRVRNTIEEKFSIEVVRMAAKVEFRFINPGEQPVTVTGISLSPVTTSYVSLFPRSTANGVSGISYSHLGNYSYAPLDGATYGTLNYLVGDNGFSVAANSNNTDGLPGNKTFYMKESFSSNEGPFTVTLGLKYADQSTQTLTYQTNNIKGYINRNDWVVIPVKLSQYVIRTVGDFYPPIGGYPAMSYSVADDGSDVYTLGTQGEFSIVPELFDQLSGTAMVQNRYQIEIAVNDTQNIFVTTPSLTEGNRVISGKAGTTEGVATIVITAKLQDKPNEFTHTVKIKRAPLTGSGNN